MAVALRSSSACARARLPMPPLLEDLLLSHSRRRWEKWREKYAHRLVCLSILRAAFSLLCAGRTSVHRFRAARFARTLEKWMAVATFALDSQVARAVSRSRSRWRERTSSACNVEKEREGRGGA